MTSSVPRSSTETWSRIVLHARIMLDAVRLLGNGFVQSQTVLGPRLRSGISANISSTDTQGIRCGSQERAVMTSVIGVECRPARMHLQPPITLPSYVKMARFGSSNGRQQQRRCKLWRLTSPLMGTFWNGWRFSNTWDASWRWMTMTSQQYATICGKLGKSGLVCRGSFVQRMQHPGLAVCSIRRLFRRFYYSEARLGI